MKGIFSVEITDKGEHWHKEIRIFGVLVYHRHDYTKGGRQRTCGFNTMPYAPVDVSEDDGWEDLKLKRK